MALIYQPNQLYIISIVSLITKQEILDLKNKTLSFDSIILPVRKYLANLDTYLLNQIEVLEPEVRDQVRYVLSHSGKRLRPILVAYSGLQDGFANNQDLIRLGAILELVHLATLVHDDILDEASIRHGAKTVAAKYGKDAAVLVGDVLFAHALCLASEYDTTEICRSVARATSLVCSGEISQTYSKRELNFDREHYFRIIKLKTAELFAVACSLGAKVSDKSNVKVKGLHDFGLHLGCAYQIFDDIVDLFADELKIGKTLGTDLENGKFTLPLIILLESFELRERKDWISMYQDGDTEIAIGLLNKKLNDYPIVDAVKIEFDACIEKAEKALASLSEDEARPFKQIKALVSYMFSKYL